MKFNYSILKENLKNIKKPSYDVLKVVEDTKKDPTWIHFGAGNIFRGYIARLQDELLDKGLANRGIIACETFDYEIIDKIYRPYDNLVLLATLATNKEPSYRIISSLTESLKADFNNLEEKKRLEEIFTSDNLQMVSFTITEKGYNLHQINGDLLNIVKEDLKNGPDHAVHAMSVIVALMLKRFLSGMKPVALVSMDNCSKNGDKLKASLELITNSWVENGFCPKEFKTYLFESGKVTFPLSMIDKITPRPAESIKNDIEALGISDMGAITTSKNTYIAPFVNAEVSEYLVIEDLFPNGRPKLEEAGVYFTDRDTVNKVETMKVTTCLNPLHTGLAVFGCLLNSQSIASEMETPILNKLVHKIGEEGMKVVVDPKIINPKDFLNEVLYERLPNKAIPDTPIRIATDTSQKIPVRFGETIKSYLKNPNLDLNDLVAIPLVIAGWLRYILGFDDNLEKIEQSSDPLLETLKEKLKDVTVNKYNNELDDILSNTHIFQIDLTKTVLKDKIEKYFIEMLQGKGSVLATLKRYL